MHWKCRLLNALNERVYLKWILIFIQVAIVFYDIWIRWLNSRSCSWIHMDVFSQQRIPEIEESKTIVCDGVLKNNRGTKLNVFLFERVLVLTRPATRGSQLKYQVYRQPIPANELVVEEISDGQEKRGSFKTAFSNNNTCKYACNMNNYVW